MKLEHIINQPVIETPTFDLRPLQMSDRPLIARHAGDTRVSHNSETIPHPLPDTYAQTLVAEAWSENRTIDVWAMDATKSEGAAFMGLIWLEGIGRDQSALGGWVAPEYWGLGVASSAVTAILSRNPQNSNTFFATVFQGNPASARVLSKAGFQYLGDAEAQCLARSTTVPTWTYSRRVDANV